jgi:hypothetical protein
MSEILRFFDRWRRISDNGRRSTYVFYTFHDTIAMKSYEICTVHYEDVGLGAGIETGNWSGTGNWNGN